MCIVAADLWLLQAYHHNLQVWWGEVQCWCPLLST